MQHIYTNQELFRKAMQIKAGHFEMIIMHDGQVAYMPLSIAWDKLDETKFSRLFNEVIDAFLEFYNENHERQMTNDEFMKILEFV
jgi:hypothetical protein